MAEHAVKEYIIEITDDMLKSLGWTSKKAEKHELIRCKDCKHVEQYMTMDDEHYCFCTLFDIGCLSENDYCSKAERKEE